MANMRGRVEVAEFWSLYKKNKAAVFGLVVFVSMLLLALSTDLIATSPWTLGPDRLSPPSARYIMGTDDLGRDLFSRFLFGARISLTVGFAAAAASTIVGVFVGALSGWYGGMVDEAFMRVTELFMVIPRVFFALLLVAFFGPVLMIIILVIAILSWPQTARLVRAQFLSLKEQEFVEAAKASGTSEMTIVFREILPNAMPPVWVNASLQVAAAMLVESGLAFLGLGDTSVVSWGTMLNNAQQFLHVAWWMSVFPGMGIFLAIMSFCLIGDGINDAANPRLR